MATFAEWKVVPASCSEPCPALTSSHDGDPVVTIKVEEALDTKVRGDLPPAMYSEMNAEHENCMGLEKDILGAYSEICPTSYDGNRVSSVKAEYVSDMKEEEEKVPVPVPFQVVNAEREKDAPPSSHDAKQVISIKVEEGSDIDEEENLVPFTYPGVEADDEHEETDSSNGFVTTSTQFWRKSAFQNLRAVYPYQVLTREKWCCK
ncbi:uncharacterized protein LOC111872218 [Cryptotermes secundus]|nr:uncharacterized protein LOC111872218 [Cryptotermes secundus]